MIICPSAHGVIAHSGTGGGGGGSDVIPKIAYALLGSDTTTTSTTYVSLLSCSVTVAGTSDQVQILFTASADCLTSGNTPGYQITVDGTDEGQVRSTENGVGFASVSRIISVTGLSAGSHTIAVNWKSSNGNTIRILPVTDASRYHASLVCRITTGAVYQTLATSKTSTSTTPADALISGISFTSVATTSALLIRVSACGTGTNESAVFRVTVDGTTSPNGTGDAADGSGVRFNAGMVHIVPVSAGTHTIDLKWGGGASGSTIDPTNFGTNPFDHASIWIEEVYTATDGSSPSLPRPFFAKLAADDSPISNTTLASSTFTLGASQLVLIEGSCSMGTASSTAINATIKIDGASGVAGSKTGSVFVSGTSVNSSFCTHVTTLASGSHTVILNGVSAADCSASSVPDNRHASLVIWQVQT